MIVYLRTWRFGIDTVLEFHGAHVHYDDANAILSIDRPVLKGREGVQTVVTVVSGDEFTVERCGFEQPCVHHSEDPKNPAGFSRD